MLRQLFQAHRLSGGMPGSISGWFGLLRGHGAQSRTAVSHKEIAGASGDIDPAGLLLFCLLFSPISSLLSFLLLTSAAKAYFIQTVDTLLTRFS